jgi:G3E family GTPase
MILQHPEAFLSVTLLAGEDRASRALVLDQLIQQSRSRRLTVLTFDPQRQSLAANQPAVLRRVEPKQIRIAQPGLIVPFRADLFLELNAIVRQHSADEVIVELAGEVELPGARDTLLDRFPGGICLGNIARLTRSIRVVHVNGLLEEFWAPQVASEPEETENVLSESAHSRAHGLARSIECADALAVTDRTAVDQDTFGRAVQLLRGLNPTATIVDTRLENFETVPLAASLDETLWNDDADRAPRQLRSRWAVLDTDCARLVIRAASPFHPQRFHQFVKGAWRGVLRGRGQVWIASQPETHHLWSQAGRVGVLSPKVAAALSAHGEASAKDWPQNMTFVGPKEVCANACRQLEECLLTEEEFELGPRLWHAFVDPLRGVCTRGKVDSEPWV